MNFTIITKFSSNYNSSFCYDPRFDFLAAIRAEGEPITFQVGGDVGGGAAFLAGMNPDKVVCLVEAEKTAVICAAMMPEFIWLATGGKSGFNDRVEVLDGRKVIAFPDVDAYDQWCEKAAERPSLDITVSDYLQQNATEEELNSGADIADVLIRWQHQYCHSERSEESPSSPSDVSDVSAVSHTIQPIQQIQENPIMQEIRKYISPEYWTEVAVLIEDFDLELVSVTRIESEQ